MSTKKPRAPKVEATDKPDNYVPTPREAEAAQKVIERQKSARSVRLAVKNTASSSINLSIKHPDSAVGAVLLMEALGTANEDFADAIATQIGSTVAANGEVNAKKLNGALSMVTGIKPEDEVEAMLAAQMAAVHNATMTAAAYLNNSGMLNQYEVYTRGLNKLARTFAAQVEALKKYRSSGEQSIRVQHVNVNAEQAIVGNVQTGGRGVSPEKERQSHELDATTPPSLTYAPGTPVFSNVETLRPAVQGAGREGAECVPLPRRQSGSA